MASTWVDNTVTNPAANAVIVDSGAMAGYSTYQVQAIVNATLAGNFLLQHRDATDANTLHEQELSIVANNATPFGPFNIVLQASERVRIVAKAAILGRVSCSVFYQPA